MVSARRFSRSWGREEKDPRNKIRGQAEAERPSVVVMFPAELSKDLFRRVRNEKIFWSFLILAKTIAETSQPLS